VPKNAPKPTADGEYCAPGEEKKKAAGPKGSRKLVYKVGDGESLWTIARKHDTHVESIRKWNGLKKNAVIRPGQKLDIYPGTGYKGSKSAKKTGAKKKQARSSPARSQPCRNEVSHVVESGESLWGIAKRYETHVVDIKDLNGLDTDAVRPGQRLDICPGHDYKAGARKKTAPRTSKKGRKKITYTVRDGDSLWSIAVKYKVGVADIKAWNNLKGDMVKPGKKLVIWAPK